MAEDRSRHRRRRQSGGGHRRHRKRRRSPSTKSNSGQSLAGGERDSAQLSGQGSDGNSGGGGERSHRRRGHHGKHGERRRRRRRSDSQSRSRQRNRSHSHEGKHRHRRGDRDGPPHIEWEPGQVLGQQGRYVVEKLFGDGASGRVLGCRDTSTGGMVAVKVARGAKRQRRHAETEVEVLQQLKRHDPDASRQFVVQLLDVFEHEETHFCIVFEPLAMSLRGLLQEGDGGGLCMADIRSITHQMCSCLAFFHSMGLAHGDLKCTNIMLRSPDFRLVAQPRLSGQSDEVVARPSWPFEVVVIDYGLATLTDPETGLGRSGIRVGARHIRAPEVILGLDWGVTADLWSLGCLLCTLYTGDRLFPVHEEMEHLAAVEHVSEQSIPVHMADQVPERILSKGVAFDADGRLAWPECAKDECQVRKVEDMESLSEMILQRHSTFLSLLRGMMTIDPMQRLTATGALAHPYLTNAAMLAEASDE